MSKKYYPLGHLYYCPNCGKGTENQSCENCENIKNRVNGISLIIFGLIAGSLMGTTSGIPPAITMVSTCTPIIVGVLRIIHQIKLNPPKYNTPQLTRPNKPKKWPFTYQIPQIK